ncbi:LysR family transcriptional regulator [Brucella pseudogrignonensis]|jgi:DNA-binding transcriptional LysR family regulator|uniref:LysR substrate binding domain protein n=1 Tax=Brucella pseudogrignonensis TaxID=419475 RepID=A0A256G3F6_9HYPH|nr:LysR family transcriptional regulator [Brucella pseudogrignonensis]OYR21568.1 lysR substrate binding domain protein [Brucella pseudogrignonensis]
MRQHITSLPALACFRVAAELESFSKAADRLNLTHGAVSRAVRLLEEDLGTSLFERRNRAVFLTDAGRRLAQVVARGLGEIEEEAQRIKAEHANAPVTVSCEPTLMMRWLIPRMPQFHAAHPSADVRLLAGGGQVVLGSGIDLAIRRNDFTWPETYKAQHLFDERIGPVCRPDKAATFFDSGRMNAAAILLHTRTRPSAWTTWAETTGETCSTNPGQDFEHFYFSLQAAVAGLGVAIGPWHLVQDDIRAGLLTAPQGFHLDGSAYFVLSAGEQESDSTAAAFQTWLADLVPRSASLIAATSPIHPICRR